jgi:NaMN:DMB phosphoribosyltransferase
MIFDTAEYWNISSLNHRQIVIIMDESGIGATTTSAMAVFEGFFSTLANFVKFLQYAY